MGESLLYRDFPIFIPRVLQTPEAFNSNAMLNSFICSLETLPRCVSKRPEISAAVKGFVRTADNLLLLGDELTLEEQVKHVYPIRCWLVWLPTSFLEITQGDNWVLIILAYYSALTLATLPKFPAVNSRLSVKVRVETIFSIHERLRNCDFLCTSCGELHSPRRHMEFPISVVNILTHSNQNHNVETLY